jgi:hypothetical protein
MVEGIVTLSLPAHFIDAAMHLFREAYHERTIAEGRDVSLRKFLDLWLIWKALDEGQRQQVARWIDKSAIAPPCIWVLDHLDTVFGTQVRAELEVSPGPDEIAANSWRGDSGQVGRWEGTMLDRIFGQARRISPALEHRSDWASETRV